MLFVGTSIIHPSTEGVFLLCNILDLLIYSREKEVFSDMHKAFSAFQVISTNMDKQQVAEMFAVSKNISIRCVEMNDPCMGITVFDNMVYYMPEK